MTTRKDVRQAVAKALLGNTVAGERVYTPLDWQTWDGQYPVIIVRAPSEEKDSLGRGAPQFNVVATIEVVGRLEFPADSADVGALIAEGQIEAMEDQVLKAIINGPGLMGPYGILSQYPFVRSSTGYSAKGEQHLAEVVVHIGCEFFQGPEDFYPIPAVTLTDVRINDPDVWGDQLPDPSIETDIPIPQS